MLILSLCCLLFSCAAVKPTFPSEFAADVVIEACGKEYSAVYEKRLDGDFLKFTAPKRLCGAEFLLEGNSCTVTVDGFALERDSFKAAFDFLPVEGEGEKTVGFRNYRIFNLREIK